ncbi:hypothetical protein NBRC116187_29930 [Halopseudomonas sabulinigri]|uniref:Uncharacterized protein n=1 Tax=Halopseudomonas sabulinigri TaxID=472181 RepID=A0ABP9ZT46_9GAMM
MQADGRVMLRGALPKLLQLDQAEVILRRALLIKKALQHLAKRAVVISLRGDFGRFDEVFVLSAHVEEIRFGFSLLCPDS